MAGRHASDFISTVILAAFAPQKPPRRKPPTESHQRGVVSIPQANLATLAFWGARKTEIRLAR